MNNTTNAIVGVVSLFVGLASLAVLVSSKANTVGVLAGARDFIMGSISAATNPFDDRNFGTGI